MTTLSMKSPILEQSGGSGGSTGNGVSRVRADPPPTRAGGQDDGSLPNSLKLIGNNVQTKIRNFQNILVLKVKSGPNDFLVILASISDR